MEMDHLSEYFHELNVNLMLHHHMRNYMNPDPEAKWISSDDAFANIHERQRTEARATERV